MNYQTYQPHPTLQSLVKCHWTLEIPARQDTEKQLILPDGCVDMCFILGDDIKRYTTNNDYLLQPRQMLLGQITKPFYIEPTGYVKTFAIRFYPYGFANFINTPLSEHTNTETHLGKLFGHDEAKRLYEEMIQAETTSERIRIGETFLINRLFKRATINSIVKSTVDTMLSSKGSKTLSAILKNDLTKRRQLERNFAKQIGLSPKQLSKVFRLQATLHMLLNETKENLADIAYENDYYDQSHFIKDFKEFTGITPKEFLADNKMILSSLLYKRD